MLKLGNSIKDTVIGFNAQVYVNIVSFEMSPAIISSLLVPQPKFHIATSMDGAGREKKKKRGNLKNISLISDAFVPLSSLVRCSLRTSEARMALRPPPPQHLTQTKCVLRCRCVAHTAIGKGIGK